MEALEAVKADLGNLVGQTANPEVYPRVPAGQVRQVAEAVAPVVWEYVPAEQLKQMESPEVFPKVPGGQFMQLEAWVLMYFPARQEVQ